jgi:hypothetical protein
MPEKRGARSLCTIVAAHSSLDAATRKKIDYILSAAITDPIGPAFMAPAPRS